MTGPITVLHNGHVKNSDWVSSIGMHYCVPCDKFFTPQKSLTPSPVFMSQQQYKVSDQSAGWDMIGTLATALGAPNPTTKQRSEAMKLVNRQMLFMTRQCFGLFFTQPAREKEVLPTEDIEAVIKRIYGFNQVSE